MLKPFATKLDETIIEKLGQLSQKTQIPKSRLLRQAIELLVERYEQMEADQLCGEKIRNRELESIASS